MIDRHRLAIALVLGLQTAAQAQVASPAVENFASWELLQPEFESTGGGGVIIKGYAPVVSGAVCTTDFTATEPSGAIYENSIVFTATPVQGGVLCHEGKWRAKDGSATGTTPFRVFIKDGVSRRSP